MDATPERFAYRCLPLAIANAHGWEIGSPCAFEARWNGGADAEAVEIRIDAGTETAHVPVSLFGQGTLTFHVEGLFRTDAGWNLWIGGAPNVAKDGISPLGGVIETDWSPYSFTMNWRFTRANQWVRWEADEPFCFFFPVQRGVLDTIEPVIRPMAEAPELEEAFSSWSASRDAFQEHVRKTNPSAPADKWQKLYYRGVRPDGQAGIRDHQAKLRLPEFRHEGSGKPSSCPFRPSGRGTIPRILVDPGQASSPPEPTALAADALDFTLRNLGFDAQPLVRRAKTAAPLPKLPPPVTGPAATPPRGPSRPQAPPAMPSADRELARRDWIMQAAERQRALSPRCAGIPRVRDLTAEAFLDTYYAPGRPVVIEGAMDGWPALDLWSPAYLAETIGDVLVEYQGGRDGNPDFELSKHQHQRRMPFTHFIKAVTADGAGNDAYITAYNSGANREALAPLKRDLGELGRYLTAGDGMIWIGPAGTFTPLHFDLTNNLLAQVIGRKRLVLLPPSETPLLMNARHVFSEVHDIEDREQLARFPAARRAKSFDVELAPGELLYIPVGWWHQVRSVDFSAMLTYTNFRWSNEAYESFPDK